MNRPPEVCDAVEAVEICSNPGISWNIMGIVAQDKRFEAMLNDLLDVEYNDHTTTKSPNIRT